MLLPKFSILHLIPKWEVVKNQRTLQSPLVCLDDVKNNDKELILTAKTKSRIGVKIVP